LNNIVENVLRELDFQAGLVLGTYGIDADLKSIQKLLNRTSIKSDLKEASHVIFRTHFIRKALTRNDAEDACYNLIVLWDYCSKSTNKAYNEILSESIDKLRKVTNKRIETVKNRHLRVLELNKMKWSIDAIAADTGYSRRQISRVINGHTKD
jgi:AraC-like DNA-binding protein